MPKPIARSKTRKAVAKRFKITGTGKVLRSHATRRHLMATKNAKRKRQLAKSAVVHKTDVKRIKANLPFALDLWSGAATLLRERLDSGGLRPLKGAAS